MGHFQRLSRLSVIAMLPLVACGGNTIQLGEDNGTGGTGAGAGGSTSSGTGGYGLGGSSGSGNPPDGGPPVVCPAENPTMVTEAGTMMNSAETADEGVCPCTRRPAGTPDMTCAAGDGTSVTFLMTPQGGSFSLGGWQAQQSGVYVRLDVPQGAVSAPTWITLTETTCPPPASYVDASPLYQFAPADLVFSRPINVRIPYGASGRFPPTQSIYLSAAGDTYERVPDSNINAGFMQGSITHFGFIFAGYPKSPEQATCP